MSSSAAVRVVSVVAGPASVMGLPTASLTTAPVGPLGIAALTSPAVAPTPPPAAGAKKSPVLIIEEDAAASELVAKTLSAAGYESCCCGSADEAFAVAERRHPLLIIADILLAGMSGIRICQQIKERSHLAEVPVMFLSGAQAADIIRRSHETGCAYHLRKPFEPRVLVELVEKAIMATSH